MRVPLSIASPSTSLTDRPRIHPRKSRATGNHREPKSVLLDGPKPRLRATSFKLLGHCESRCGRGVHVFSLQGTTQRERALKMVLVLVGLLFSALVYPLIAFLRQEPALSMMFSLYVTLGIFLLLAVANPSANRSLIAFPAWSSFAHATVMAVRHSRM
jgi:hypothetical protein